VPTRQDFRRAAERARRTPARRATRCATRRAGRRRCGDSTSHRSRALASQASICKETARCFTRPSALAGCASIIHRTARQHQARRAFLARSRAGLCGRISCARAIRPAAEVCQKPNEMHARGGGVRPCAASAVPSYASTQVPYYVHLRSCATLDMTCRLIRGSSACRRRLRLPHGTLNV